MIDTAMAYRNHEEIGEALRASGVKREDVWITSKLASGTVNSYAKGISAIDNIDPMCELPPLLVITTAFFLIFKASCLTFSKLVINIIYSTTAKPT